MTVSMAKICCVVLFASPQALSGSTSAQHSSSASISAALTAAAALLQASPGRMVVFRISDGNTHAVRSTAHTKQPPSHGFSRRSARKPSSSSTVPMAGRR